jgi:hypothetical protein
MNPAMIGAAAALLLFNQHHPAPYLAYPSSSSSESSSGSESEDEEMYFEEMEMEDEFYLAVLAAMEEGPVEKWNPDPDRPRNLDDVKRSLDEDTFLHYFRFTPPQIDYLLYHIEIPRTFQPPG